MGWQLHCEHEFFLQTKGQDLRQLCFRTLYLPHSVKWMPRVIYRQTLTTLFPRLRAKNIMSRKCLAFQFQSNLTSLGTILLAFFCLLRKISLFYFSERTSPVPPTQTRLKNQEMTTSKFHCLFPPAFRSEPPVSHSVHMTYLGSLQSGHAFHPFPSLL